MRDNDSSTTEILDHLLDELFGDVSSSSKPSVDAKQVHKNLEDTIEFLACGNTSLYFDSDDSFEEIELLDEEIEEFTEAKVSLENTIELLDIVQPVEPIVVKKKVKPKKRPWIILLSCCFIILAVVSYKVFFWGRDSFKTNQQIEKIVSDTKVNDAVIPEDFFKDDTGTDLETNNLTYFNADFTNLLQQNSDVKGWIKVNNTNINYPFVQTTDNTFYLRHSFDKSKNYAGWVFADFRNHFSSLDENTILYAHGRLDNTMFGSLKQVVEEAWYQNVDNHFVHLSGLQENSIWKVFSVYTIEPETYYITPNFNTKAEFQKFLTILSGRSVYDFQVDLDENDKILTLSSCYNDTLRVVLHAKLVGIEERDE